MKQFYKSSVYKKEKKIPRKNKISEPQENILFLIYQNLGLTIHDEDKRKELLAKARARTASETSAVFASSRMWDDGIILPQDTRQVGNN